MAADNRAGGVAILGEQMVLLAQQVAGVKSAADGASAGLSTARRELVGRLDKLDQALANTADWSADIQELRDAIDELKEEIAKLAAQQDLRVWDWTNLTEDAASEAWDTLQGWMDDVADHQLGLVEWSRRRGRMNREDGEKLTHIPPCWRQHRDVVLLLSPLCQEWMRVWQTSYGAPSKALDWSARHVPGVLSRIASSSAHACTHWCQGPHGWEGQGSILNQVAADDVHADTEVQSRHREQAMAARNDTSRRPPADRPSPAAPAAQPQQRQQWSPTPAPGRPGQWQQPPTE